MASAFPYQSTCCNPCEDPVIINIPGAPGDAVGQGDDGADGVNAFTTTTAQFVMPAELANVSVTVANTAWMVVGQPLFVQTAGFMQVVGITNDITVVLKNIADSSIPSYAINAAPATVIPINSKIAPGGLQGPSGIGGSVVSTVGSGSPEGAVLGKPGDLWLDDTTDTRWVKKTGVNTTTGWV